MKNGLRYTLGVFLQNSSDHPGWKKCAEEVKKTVIFIFRADFFFVGLVIAPTFIGQLTHSFQPWNKKICKTLAKKETLLSISGQKKRFHFIFCAKLRLKTKRNNE
jgi:hypothetical protein